MIKVKKKKKKHISKAKNSVGDRGYSILKASQGPVRAAQRNKKKLHKNCSVFKIYV